MGLSDTYGILTCEDELGKIYLDSRFISMLSTTSQLQVINDWLRYLRFLQQELETVRDLKIKEGELDD